MSLRFTLLGFLSYGPMTGYDLKKHIDNSTQFFWHASLSQIYPTLKRMDEDGLVEAAVIPQEGRPDKKVYTITPAGQAALMDWLAEPLGELSPQKDPALLKLFFSGVLNREAILAHLCRHQELHRARLAHYRKETASYIEQIIVATDFTREGIMWELVRQWGEQYEQAYIQWLEQAIATIEEEF